MVRDLDEVAEIVDSFKDPRTRTAIRHVVSAVVDWRGQVVTMVDRAYLTQAMPMCVIWGTEDSVIPVRHAGIVAELAPGATVEVIANAGHFPHKDHPQRFVEDPRRVRPPQPAGGLPPRTLALAAEERSRHARAGRGPAGAPGRDRLSTGRRALARDDDAVAQASPPSCLTSRTAVGSSIW